MTIISKTACKFSFADSPSWSGFTDGTTWNGWANVWCSPEVRDEIADYCESMRDDEESIAQMRARPVGEDGLVSLADGFAAEIDGARPRPKPLTVDAKAAYLAGIFADVVWEWTTPDQWAEMLRRNRTAPAGVCASHDFMDANMAMEAAFKRAFGREPVTNFETEEDAKADKPLPDLDLWNKAWDHAKAGWLTAQEDEKPPITLDEFRASRKQEAERFVYAGDLQIDCEGGKYCLTIYNESEVSTDLAALEAKLYAFGLEGDYFSA